MATDYETRTIVDPGSTGLGTAFSKLDEKERKFVIALLELGTDDRTQAVILAGYTGTPGALRARASRLFHNPLVQQALHELSMERLAGAKPMLTSQLLDIAQNGKSESARLRAIEMAMNRIGMHAITEHHVQVEDKSKSREALERELIELAKRNPSALGMLPERLQKLVALPAPVNSGVDKVIDAEYSEVDKEEWN